MGSIKPRETFLEPDPCSQCFVKLKEGAETVEPMNIDDQYALLSHCQLHAGVPEKIRNYHASVQSLWLYGWLYYPFYTLAAFLSTTAIEMALRERIPAKLGHRDNRGLSDLLHQAKSRELLKDEGFPRLRARREEEEMVAQTFGDREAQVAASVPSRPYIDDLISYLPRIRNTFAHPTDQWIFAPGMALDNLILATEVINQLWDAPVQSGRVGTPG